MSCRLIRGDIVEREERYDTPRVNANVALSSKGLGLGEKRGGSLSDLC